MTLGELVREREDDWLGDLRGRLGPAEEKRREAQRLLDEAIVDEWQLHQVWRLGADWPRRNPVRLYQGSTGSANTTRVLGQ